MPRRTDQESMDSFEPKTDIERQAQDLELRARAQEARRLLVELEAQFEAGIMAIRKKIEALKLGTRRDQLITGQVYHDLKELLELCPRSIKDVLMEFFKQSGKAEQIDLAGLIGGMVANLESRLAELAETPDNNRDNVMYIRVAPVVIKKLQVMLEYHKLGNMRSRPRYRSKPLGDS